VDTTRLSSKGQVIIPKLFRKSLRWEPGQELVVVGVGNSLLLRPKSPFPKTAVDDVAGCLRYKGEAKTLDEMDRAIAQGAREHQHGVD
jgi:AbrB family looped-hinge helix DNA binding protein